MKKYIAALLVMLTTTVSHAALIEYKFTAVDSTFDPSETLSYYIYTRTSVTSYTVPSFGIEHS